jgi:hypothetical protein
MAGFLLYLLNPGFELTQLVEEHPNVGSVDVALVVGCHPGRFEPPELLLGQLDETECVLPVACDVRRES